MKKKLFMASMLVLFLMLAFSTSVALADKMPKTVGERIYLNDTPDNPDFPYPAGDPFHVIHGFVAYYQINEPIGNGVALSKMTLEVDGELVEPDTIEYDWAAYPQYDIGWKVVVKLYTFNFPEGLSSGEHTFVRRYFFTCQSYLKMGEVESCDHPGELIEDLEVGSSYVVDFE
jgi:hypothetical protein